MSIEDIRDRGVVNVLHTTVVEDQSYRDARRDAERSRKDSSHGAKMVAMASWASRKQPQLPHNCTRGCSGTCSRQQSC